MVRIPAMKVPKFGVRAEGSDGGGTAPVGPPQKGPGAEGEWKGAQFRKTETPHISLSDVSVSLKGSQRGAAAPKGHGDPKGLRGDTPVGAVGLEGKGTDVGGDGKGPQWGVGGHRVGVGAAGGGVLGAKGGVKGPTFGVEAPQVDIRGPQFGGEVPKVDVKGPKVDIKGPQFGVEVPKVDIKGPKVDIGGPQFGVEVPKVDIKGPQFGV